MALKITKYVRNTTCLTFSEIGLLDYMLSNVDSNGHFQKDLGTMARDGDTTVSSVHRWQKGLILKGAIEVIKKSRTGRYGHRTPPVFKPLIPRTAMGLAFGQRMELAQVTDSEQPNLSHDPAEKHTMGKEKPIPRGMLTTNTVNGGCDCSVDDDSTRVGGKTTDCSGVNAEAPAAKKFDFWESMREEVHKRRMAQ